MSKIENNKIKDALRILSEDNGLAQESVQTLHLLEHKHPKPSFVINAPAPSNNDHLEVSTNLVQNALQSFCPGSSGGIDGLLPQHLKDIFLNIDETTEKQARIQSVTNFVNLVLSGHIPEQVRPLFFAARLIALNKKDGGVRPIAISNTWRRLISKLVAKIGSKNAQSCLVAHNLALARVVGVRSLRI